VPIEPPNRRGLAYPAAAALPSGAELPAAGDRRGTIAPQKQISRAAAVTHLGATARGCFNRHLRQLPQC